jgi:hypothetical protein
VRVDRIESLIQTARDVIDRGLDIRIFVRWRKEAVEYLEEHLGPNHYYTRYFACHTRKMERQQLLTGTGVLAAVREQISERVADKVG